MKDYLYESLKNKILDFKDGIDIYVISLYVYDRDGDPRYKTVTLGYNTNKHFKKSIKDAFDEAEAKWNYAYYLQNEELVIGVNETEKAMITNWIKDNNLYFSDQKLVENHEKAMIIGEEITKQFVKVLIDVVKRLHQEGIIKQKFIIEIPIIIHELEYYDDIAKQNKLANPENVIKEFVEWIENI
ncbi:MAG: hypothetical protein K0Q49_749 [Haloplasmataceae bacterium]|jgi:hypothetical protein|nr:hypothetical protein [Haloplasmataceae bacterium]